jgi:hypothetical protein
VLVHAISYIGYTLAHRRAAEMDDGAEIPLRTGARLVAAGFGAFSLSGGFSVDRRALSAMGLSDDEAAVRVLALGTLEYVVLAPVTWVCALVLLIGSRPHTTFTLPWVIGVPVGGAIALWLTAPGRAERRRRSGVLGRWFSRVLEAADMLREIVRHPIAQCEALLGITAYWAGEVLALWAWLRAFDVHFSAAGLIVAFATGYVLTPRALPLLGVGVIEVLLPLSLHWLGMGWAAAAVSAGAYRLMRLLFSIPPSLAARPAVERIVSGSGLSSATRPPAAEPATATVEDSST